MTLRYDDIGMTDYAPVAYAKPIAVRPEHLADEHLWQGVARVYRRHDLGALLFRYSVHVAHYTKSA